MLVRTLFLAVTLIILCGAPGVWAQDIPEDIMIFNEGYRRKLYEPVWFPHLIHAEDFGFECSQCHHNYQDGENVWEEGDPVKPCAACHDPVKKKGGVLRLYIAYHFNCKKCHQEIESGPIECGECHTKIQRD